MITTLLLSLLTYYPFLNLFSESALETLKRFVKWGKILPVPWFLRHIITRLWAAYIWGYTFIDIRNKWDYRDIQRHWPFRASFTLFACWVWYNVYDIYPWVYLTSSSSNFWPVCVDWSALQSADTENMREPRTVRWPRESPTLLNTLIIVSVWNVEYHRSYRLIIITWIVN